MSRFTEVEKETIRNGAMAALGYVSDADEEGLFGSLREARAGTKALRQLPDDLHDAVLGDYNTPEGYAHPASDDVRSYLADALAVIAGKAPDMLPEFKRILIDACEATAAAAKGVSEAERRAIDDVREALH